MKCSKFEKLKMKYIDGTITDEERDLLLKHTQNCGECGKDILLYQSIFEDVKYISSPYPNEDFTANVMKAVEKLPIPKKEDAFCFIAAFAVCIMSVFAGMWNLIVLNRSELISMAARTEVSIPARDIINAIARTDAVINGFISQAVSFYSIYADSLVYGIFAASVIGLGIYTALKNQLSEA